MPKISYLQTYSSQINLAMYYDVATGSAYPLTHSNKSHLANTKNFLSFISDIYIISKSIRCHIIGIQIVNNNLDFDFLLNN